MHMLAVGHHNWAAVFWFADGDLRSSKPAARKPAVDGRGNKSQFRAYLDADWKPMDGKYPDVATQWDIRDKTIAGLAIPPPGHERRKRHLAESIAELKGIHRDTVAGRRKAEF